MNKVWPSMLSLFYNEAWNENFLKRNDSSAVHGFDMVHSTQGGQRQAWFEKY